MESYRHVLCATDFSAGSARACGRAAALATCFEARLTLLHVVDHFPEDRSNQNIPPEDMDPQDYEEQEARRRLGELASGVAFKDAHLAVRFVSRSAWQEIADYAREAGADLLVLSEHVHGGLRALMPSTVGHLSVHPACDLLVVPALPQAT